MNELIIYCDTKSSFNRFDVYSTEHILSYLNIEDKLRFECLSKRFQSLIFNKMFELKVDTKCKFVGKNGKLQTFGGRHHIDCKIFESILKKFQYLSAIEIVGEIVVDSQVLRLIADNCNHLRHLSIKTGLTLDLTEECIEYFGQRCGTSIESLKTDFAFSDQMIRKLISFTPNLKSIESKNSITFFNKKLKISTKSNGLSKLVPKLQDIDVIFRIKEEEQFLFCHHFNQFAEEYSETLLRLKIGFECKLQIDSLQTIMKAIGRFHRLKSLSLYIFDNNSSVVCEELKQMSTKFKDLKELRFYNYSKLNDLQAFSRFSRLTYLFINTRGQSYQSIRGLRKLKQLKRLKLLWTELSDDNFKDITKYWPNLESILVQTSGVISNQSLKYFSRLKALKSLSILIQRYPEPTQRQPLIDDSGVVKLVKDCQPLRRLILCNRSGFRFKIGINSIGAFKQKALQMPKIRFYFGSQLDINFLVRLFGWRAFHMAMFYPNNLIVDRKPYRQLHKTLYSF